MDIKPFYFIWDFSKSPINEYSDDGVKYENI